MTFEREMRNKRDKDFYQLSSTNYHYDSDHTTVSVRKEYALLCVLSCQLSKLKDQCHLAVYIP